MEEFHREQLATLQAVVETGSFDAAAERLHVSQPAISQRIKALEQTVGRVLLKRTRPLEPTESARVLLRHAIQLSLLEAEVLAELGLGAGDTTAPALTVVVNADSLSTWFLDALVTADRDHGLDVEVLREDEFHATRHLIDGTVMAAVTAQPTDVRGCTTTRLGTMRYLPCASPDFVARHLPEGITPAALGRAPVVEFDRRDELQARFQRSLTRREPGPRRRYVPASAEFRTAVVRGLGWGLLPEQHCLELLASGDLARISPTRHLDVPLFWQTWRVAPAGLEALTGIVVATAAAALHQ
jgi:LysR family transcriptional regulator (chromosome initiation inhibitor)